MQLLNVQGRICATEDSTNIKEIEQLLRTLPRGMYMATAPLQVTLPGVAIVARNVTTHILGVAAPSLPKV